ncbi:uncharacterized protein LOC134261999 isoform X2 [Saccostrea cucullata]|uniref:uncharacterized protein LOC134261999 isoform X2 n=1 Tax=Saccostrea cuccullata TaxID=36930 RepID=UPI002ED50439
MNVELKPVTSCPTNASLWLSNGIKLQCPNDTLGRNLYQCVPNDDRSSLVEFCLQGSIGRYGANLCPFAVSTGHLDALNCSTFLSGCPEESYNTDEVYKYPACLEINPEKRCYLARENCHSDSMSVSPNTSYAFQPDDDITTIIAWVGSSIIGVVILLIVLFLLYKRRCESNSTGSEEEEMPFLPRRSEYLRIKDSNSKRNFLCFAALTRFSSILNDAKLN